MKQKRELKHRNLVVGLHHALTEFLEPNKYAHRILESLFKKNKIWGSKDRAFVSEAFYDIIRWKRLYEYYTQKPLEAKNIYSFIVAYLLRNNYDFPRWDIFENVNFKRIIKQLKLPPVDESIQYSMPDWMMEKFKELPNYRKEIEALNNPAEVVLRVNTLKINKKELQINLQTEGIETVTITDYPDALQLKHKQNVFTSKSFKEGLFEIQDANSQKVVETLEPKEGEKVIDACAGAGGKALHMAALMQNKGQIYALDIYDWKLKELKKRAKRDGVHNIQTITVTDTKSWKKLKNTANMVLIDAPCSGSGVLRRNPDSKWKLTADKFENILIEQQQILQQYSSITAKNGILMYATCSIFKEENEEQVKKFLTNNPNFELVFQKALYPAETGYDGFFMAKMLKIND